MTAPDLIALVYPPTIGGLTAEEWEHCARVMWKWPRLDVCSAAEAEQLVDRCNQNAAVLHTLTKDTPDG